MHLFEIYAVWSVYIGSESLSAGRKRKKGVSGLEGRV